MLFGSKPNCFYNYSEYYFIPASILSLENSYGVPAYIAKLPSISTNCIISDDLNPGIRLRKNGELLVGMVQTYTTPNRTESEDTIKNSLYTMSDIVLKKCWRTGIYKIVRNRFWQPEEEFVSLGDFLDNLKMRGFQINK